MLYETSVPDGQELWEAVWMPAAQGAFPEPRISHAPLAVTEGDPKQPEGGL